MTTSLSVATAAIPRLVPPPPLSIDMSSLSPPPTPPPLVSVNRNTAAPKHNAVVVMGATGTGKTRLAVELARRFGGEVINADKLQIYQGLDVATNKATADERAGVPHHLIGVVASPDAEFTAQDFRREACRAARAVAARGALPIVAGGSNSYIEELVDGGGDGERRRGAFREMFDVCFLWVDVQLPVLHGFVGRRVDDMLRRGLVAEVAAALDPRRRRADGNYSRGVWRAIGVPELDAYLRSCLAGDGVEEEEERARLLDIAVEEIKANTRRLSCRQRDKIERLERLWRVRRVDATEAFRRRGEDADEAWERLVAAPSIDIVRSFLHGDYAAADLSNVDTTTTSASLIPMFALAAAGAGV